MKIKHFLLSRFNLSKPAYDEWWLGRVELFEKYTLPSMKAQTNQDFIWLMLFDSNTHDRCKREIDEWVRQYPNFKSLFVKGKNTWIHSKGPMSNGDSAAVNVGSIKAAIRNLSFDATHILTTRCDNDDLLHNDYLQKVRAKAEASDGQRHIICYPQGLVMWIDAPKPQGKPFKVLTNMYLSLMEPVEDFITVNDRKHHGWRFCDPNDEVPVINVKDEPMWCWVRHDLAASKTVVSRGPCVNEEQFLKGFR